MSALALATILPSSFLAAEPDLVFYMQEDPSDDTVHVARPDGSGARSIANSDTIGVDDRWNLLGLATDGERLFWGGYNAGFGLLTASLNGNEARVLIPNVGVVDIEVAGGRIYWIDNIRISSAHIDGTNVRTLIEGQGQALHALAVDGSRLFWARDRENAQIRTSDLNGNNVRVLVDFNTVFGAAYYDVPGLAVTSDAIYWVTGPAQLPRGLWKAGRDGSNPHKIADLPKYAYSLVAFNDRLYFGGGDSIYTSDLNGRDLRLLFNTGLRDTSGIALYSKPDPTPPEIRHLRPVGTQLEIDFTGILQHSSDLRSWTDLSPQPASPFRTDLTGPDRYFRARSQ